MIEIKNVVHAHCKCTVILAYIPALERTLLSPTYKLESSLPQDYNIPAMQEYFRQRPRDVFQRTTQILSEIGQCINGSSMTLFFYYPCGNSKYRILFGLFCVISGFLAALRAHGSAHPSFYAH